MTSPDEKKSTGGLPISRNRVFLLNLLALPSRQTILKGFVHHASGSIALRSAEADVIFSSWSGDCAVDVEKNDLVTVDIQTF